MCSASPSPPVPPLPVVQPVVQKCMYVCMSAASHVWLCLSLPPCGGGTWWWRGAEYVSLYVCVYVMQCTVMSCIVMSCNAM